MIEPKERAEIEIRIKEELKKEKLSSKEIIERLSTCLFDSLKIRKVLKDMKHYGNVVTNGIKNGTKYKLIDVKYEDNNL